MPFTALATSLQRLDVLAASERRALQLHEGQLFKLNDSALEDRSAAESALCALASGYVSPDNLPLCVDAKAHSLPSAIRPHLQWIIRTLLLLRHPSLLPWLLHLRAVHSRDDEAWLASGVAALLDAFHPADVLRQRALLHNLCKIELHQLDGCAGALVPGSFFARMVGEHLCRLPAARRCLHRALRGPLEAFLDAPRRGDPALGARHESADVVEWRALVASMGAARRAFDDACNGADGGDVGRRAEEEDADDEEGGEGEDSDVEARALRRLIDSLASSAAAIPAPLSLICASVSQWADTRGLDGTALAADAIVCCWLAPALGAPHAFGVGLLSASDTQGSVLASLSLRLRSLTQSEEEQEAWLAEADGAAPNARRTGATRAHAVRELLRARLRALAEAVLVEGDDAAARRSVELPNLDVPDWDVEAPHTVAITARQLAALLALMRGTSVHTLRAATSIDSHKGGRGAVPWRPKLPSSRICSLLDRATSALDFNALLGAMAADQAGEPAADATSSRPDGGVAASAGSAGAPAIVIPFDSIANAPAASAHTLRLAVGDGILSALAPTALLKIPLASDDDDDEYAHLPSYLPWQRGSLPTSLGNVAPFPSDRPWYAWNAGMPISVVPRTARRRRTGRCRRASMPIRPDM